MAFVRLSARLPSGAFTLARPTPSLCPSSHGRFLLGGYRSVSALAGNKAISSTVTSDAGSLLVTSDASLVGEAIRPVSNLAACKLGGWTPPGLIQEALGYAHFELDVPWWAVIVVGAVCARLLVLPFQALAFRHSARLHNCAPEREEIQARLQKALVKGDLDEASKAQAEFIDIFKRHNTNVFKPLMAVPVALPIFLSFTSALIGMNTASPPLAGLTSGGFLWMSDLTTTDPYLIVPAIGVAASLVSVELGSDTGVELDRSAKMYIRSLALVALGVSICFPASFQLYFATNSIMTAFSGYLLRTQPVGRLLGIPERVKRPPIDDKDKKSLDDFLLGFRLSVQARRKSPVVLEEAKASLWQSWLEKNDKELEEFEKTNQKLMEERKAKLKKEDEWERTPVTEDLRLLDLDYEDLTERRKSDNGKKKKPLLFKDVNEVKRKTHFKNLDTEYSFKP